MRRALSPALKASESLSGYFGTDNNPYSEIHDPRLKNQCWTLQTALKTSKGKEVPLLLQVSSCHSGCGMVSTNYGGILHLGIPVKPGKLNLGLSLSAQQLKRELRIWLLPCSVAVLGMWKRSPLTSVLLYVFCFIHSYLSFYLDFILFHLYCKTQLLCWLQSRKILRMTQPKRFDTRTLRAASGGGSMRQHRSWMSHNTH